ncbi:predicted protein [Nematostella vectensis]|uniref:G-protein coupled receptors family 1 profile domain-containing protein n=1 Tax=Nematostella vectensis TaxID=45351 RepID=A7RU07_NEMVE|nr:predicted protein [Nematostella vectensis]|eukprot:XP_001637183.1 predicted protein [Nematostella vectensis]
MTYTFMPLEYPAKVSLTVTAYTIGILAAVGNALIIHFTRTEKRAARALGRAHASYFVLSLATSDLCASIISIPLSTTQMFIDFLTSDWRCKAYRTVIISFPVITINNLVVIAVERYLAVLRPFHLPSNRLVKVLIAGAWVAGVLMTMVYTATSGMIPAIIDQDHFTLVCFTDDTVTTHRVMVLIFIVIMNLIPTIGLLIIAILITRHLNKRTVSPEVRSNQKSDAWKHKTTRMFVTIVVSFAAPYLLWFVYIALNITVKPDLRFAEEFIIRYSFSIMALSNGMVNVFIYFSYIKQLRKRLRSVFDRA